MGRKSLGGFAAPTLLILEEISLEKQLEKTQHRVEVLESEPANVSSVYCLKKGCLILFAVSLEWC